MYKQLIQSVFVIVIPISMSACGNKGDLYLPDDAGLAQEPLPGSVQMSGSIDEVGDNEVFQEKKQMIIKP